MKSLCTYLIVLFLLFSQNIKSFGQNIELNSKSLSEYVQIEKKLNSELVGFKNFNPSYDPYVKENKIQLVQKPLIFKRTDDNFVLQLHTWYFYDQDSIVKAIYYNWGLYNTSSSPKYDSEFLIQQTKQFKKYNRKYKKLKRKLNRTVHQKGKEAPIMERFNGYVKSTEWTDETSKIILKLTHDFQLHEIPVVGKTGDFQIIIKRYFKD